MRLKSVLGMTLLLITWMTVMSNTVSAAATHYKIFILTGQSNSLGVTNGGEADPTSGPDAADQHILFSWHNRVSASTSLGHSGQTLLPVQATADFTTLQDQQGGFYAGSATHWGPEVEFARTLYRAGVRDFGVIKVSRGGGGNTNWHKGSGGHMYLQVTTTVAEAVASLPGGDTYEIVGLLYLQGESDSGGEAAIAGTRIKELTDNLRIDLANASSMHTVIGGIAAAGGNRNTVRANQAAIAASTSYIDYFENVDQQPKLHDGLHFNREAKITVGQRYAQAFFDAGIVSRHYGKLTFMGNSITQGGNGNPSYRYQVFTNLANKNVPTSATMGYEFVGSVTGAYQNNSGATPDVNGQTFINQHDGHWGWRAFWMNARLALPGGRYNTNNLGQGTVENWTGQTTTFETVDQGTLTYTGSTYIPDTVVIKIGINDLSGGASAAQVRDDIALIIDQLRAANANARIHVSQVLYSNNVAFASVDALNALLPQLVIDKNATSTSSPVWLITTNEGFDPGTLTYDNTHPNALGEVYVGDRISGGLGIIEMPEPIAGASIPPVTEKDHVNLTTCFEGNEIYNGATYINGWSEPANASHVSETLNGTDLNRNQNGGNGASWLEGVASSRNGGTTTWATGNDGDWTWESRIRVNASPNGFIFWLGTGSKRIWVVINNGNTQNNGGAGFNVSHTNNDGNFHTWRITHDSVFGRYYVWRDRVLLTLAPGIGYDSSGSDERMIIGDYTGTGSFGNGHNIDIDYICYDQTGAFAPVSNNPPNFNSDPVVKPDGQILTPYSGTLDGTATDAEDDTLTYSKLGGPAWLSVATDGTLSGTPTAGDGGLNTFNVEVSDGDGVDHATLQITINSVSNDPASAKHWMLF